MSGTVTQLEQAGALQEGQHSPRPIVPMTQGDRSGHPIIDKGQGMIKPAKEDAQKKTENHDNKTRV
jgi:hypothetical protein